MCKFCEIHDDLLDAPKSRAVERVAAAHGVPAVDIPLPRVDPSDLLGYPVVRED
jgi:MoxR-like ATPase